MSPNSAVRPRSLSLVNFTTDMPHDPKVPKNRRMLCRRSGAVMFSIQAHRTIPTGSVLDTSTGFLLTYMMSQCMCCSTNRRRVTGSCGGGIGFVLVVLPLSAATCGPQIAVARLTSAAMTVQQKRTSIQSSNELVVGRESEAGLKPSSLGASLNFAFRVKRFVSRNCR
jgi:hypothetical protein